MNLYNKYRPKTFDKIIGNESTVRSLQSCLQKKEAHTFLLEGPTGCGKTTLARIMASELGCKGLDLKEIDSADFRGIDTARSLRRTHEFLPIESSCKICILDECHKMTNDAQNALLKILEEPPDHVYFILCTTEPHKLLDTILGRCLRFKVEALEEEQIFKLLTHIMRGEKKRVSKQTREQISVDCLGRPRNAIQILEKIINLEPDQMLESAKQEADKENEIIELCRALIQNKSWKKISKILQGLKKQDPENIRRVVLGYCNSILLKDTNSHAAYIMEMFEEPTYNIGQPGITLACYRIIAGK